jgi:hypothetical protein
VIRSAVAGVLVQDLAADGEGLLVLAEVVDRVERTGHGLLLTVLAQVDQVKAVKGGVGPWLAAQLGYQPGRGRAWRRMRGGSVACRNWLSR